MKLEEKYVLLDVSVVDGYGGYPESDMFVKVEEQLITGNDRDGDFCSRKFMIASSKSKNVIY